MSVARVYRVGSPFNGSELAEMDFEQSANTMYLAHLNHVPCKLVRSSHTSWAFSDVTFAPTISAPTGVSVAATYANTDAPNSGAANNPKVSRYVVTAVDDDSGQQSRASSEVTATNTLELARNYNTISWIAVTGAERYRVYKASNIGGFGYIGTTTGTSFIDDNIGPDYTQGPPQAFNPFAGAGNYPSTVSFFEQRLVWARTTNNPNAVYASRSGEYENMDITRPLVASDSIAFKLVAGRVNAVNQLVSMDSLICVTSDGIFKVTGGQDGYISPLTFNSKRQNGRGGSRLNPLVIDAQAFYQTAVGNTVRAIGYEFQTDSTQTNDVTIFSPHLFRGFNIVSWAYAQEPRSLIWAVRDDGKLLCFTWEREQQVWGWTICETDGLVESVAVISEAGEDRLYLTVRRNGQLLIERMAAARWDAVENTCFLDSAVTFAFDPAASVCNNLDHLEGKTVSALADGQVVSGLVVSGGKVTLPFPASTVTVGLPFTATVETLPLVQQGQTGLTLGKPQQATKAVVRVIDTRGLKAGPSADRLETLRARMGELPGEPNALYTGLRETFLIPKITGGASVLLQSDDPLPMTVTGVFIDPNVAS
ncbi:MAG: hypothetical protein EBU31_00190 [Proteobacteria bacterium]|nr:hypothetical protein [Pseudomonadota bacterium]